MEQNILKNINPSADLHCNTNSKVIGAGVAYQLKETGSPSLNRITAMNLLRGHSQARQSPRFIPQSAI